MILVNQYAIWPPIPRRFSQNIVGSKSWRALSCSFTEIVFSISAAFSVSDSLLHICSNSSSCHNVFILLSLSGHSVTNKPELTRWCLCSLHAGIQISLHEIVGSCDGCRHSIAEGTVDVAVRLYRQIFGACTALFSCPFT